MTKELTMIQRAAVALTSANYESKIIDIVKSSTDITEIKNDAGLEQALRIGMNLSRIRIAVSKSGKEAREDATAYSKAVIAEEKRIIDLIRPEEDRIFALRDGFNAIKQAAKDAKIKAEQERQGAIYARIATIKAAHAACAGRTSDQISKILDKLQSFELTDAEFQELLPQAQSAVSEQILLVQNELARVIQSEKDAAELAVLRESVRVAQEAEQAKLKAEQETAAANLAVERAEFERQRAQLAAEQKIIDDERKAQDKIRDDLAAEQALELARQKAEIAEQAAKIAQAQEEQRLRERVAQESLGDEILASMVEELNADIDVAFSVAELQPTIFEIKTTSRNISKEDIITAIAEVFAISDTDAERYIRAAFEI